MSQSAWRTSTHLIYSMVSLRSFRRLLEVEGGLSHTPQFPEEIFRKLPLAAWPVRTQHFPKGGLQRLFD